VHASSASRSGDLAAALFYLTKIGTLLRILNRIVGSLVFTFKDERDFSPEELSMLVTLGSRCAGALERASLYERDRDIALTFQHRLLPGLPHVPEWIEMFVQQTLIRELVGGRRACVFQSVDELLPATI